LQSVLRIRDVYPGSRIPILSIPDPHSFHPRSRIHIKEFNYFNLKILFLSTRKYDLGCSSQIRIRSINFLPFRTPESKRTPDPGSGIRKKPIPDSGSGVKNAPDPDPDPQHGVFNGSGSATLGSSCCICDNSASQRCPNVTRFKLNISSTRSHLTAHRKIM
jgi:hypothetical protein